MDAFRDRDRAHAAIDLVGRSGAKHLEIGYQREGVPIEEADWWASAQYRGTRITVEHQTGPEQALESLALRLLTGAKCVKCGRLISLQRAGAVFFRSGSLIDGTRWDEQTVRQTVRARGMCLWQREGKRWETGCRHDRATSER
jgi:hypothetical protein